MYKRQQLQHSYTGYSNPQSTGPVVCKRPLPLLQLPLSLMKRPAVLFSVSGTHRTRTRTHSVRCLPCSVAIGGTDSQGQDQGKAVSGPANLPTSHSGSSVLRVMSDHVKLKKSRFWKMKKKKLKLISSRETELVLTNGS